MARVMARRPNVDFYNVPDVWRYGHTSSPPGWDFPLLPERGPVVEVGAGFGAFANVHPEHIALDLSHWALQRVPHGRRVQGDAESLPFRDECIPYLFSKATLEHVPRADRAFEEIHRVLAPGGDAFLAASWNCRPWAHIGFGKREDLSLRERLVGVSLLVRDRFVYRVAILAAKRLMRELVRPRRLWFRSLKANFETYCNADTDAAANIDSHAAITFFRQRGYAIESHPTFTSRMTARHEPVLVRKPAH